VAHGVFSFCCKKESTPVFFSYQVSILILALFSDFLSRELCNTPHVMRLAKKPWDLFRSSEVDEKRQLLNFVFQNLHLEGKKMVVTLAEPFNLFIEANNCPKGWGWLDSNQRRPESTELQSVAIGRYATPPVK
jgi:hypothetical protein